MRPRNFYTGGMSTYTYPHTIENGAGEQITFVRCVRDSAGDRLEVENLAKPDSGPRCTSTTTSRRLRTVDADYWESFFYELR
jgi:hypothetical protein